MKIKDKKTNTILIVESVAIINQLLANTNRYEEVREVFIPEKKVIQKNDRR